MAAPRESKSTRKATAASVRTRTRNQLEADQLGRVEASSGSGSGSNMTPRARPDPNHNNQKRERRRKVRTLLGSSLDRMKTSPVLSERNAPTNSTPLALATYAADTGKMVTIGVR